MLTAMNRYDPVSPVIMYGWHRSSCIVPIMFFFSGRSLASPKSETLLSEKSRSRLAGLRSRWIRRLARVQKVHPLRKLNRVAQGAPEGERRSARSEGPHHIEKRALISSRSSPRNSP